MASMKICILHHPAIIMWYKNKLIRFHFILFILLLLGSVGFGQNNKLFFQTNYATFQMNDLKEMQLDLYGDFQAIVDGKVVSSFPAFIGHELNYNSKLGEDHQMGGYVSYYSTGGRIHYKDYSGEFKLDQLVKNLSVGLYNEFIFYHFTKSELFLSVRSGLSITDYEIASSTKVGEENESQSIYFNSINFHLSPGIGYQQSLGKLFFLQVETRYEPHFPGSLRLDSNWDAKLIDDNGNEVTANWDGFRFGFSLGLRF